MGVAWRIPEGHLLPLGLQLSARQSLPGTQLSLYSRPGACAATHAVVPGAGRNAEGNRNTERRGLAWRYHRAVTKVHDSLQAPLSTHTLSDSDAWRDAVR